MAKKRRPPRKRAPKPTRADRKRDRPATDRPPLPDRRLIERTFRDIAALLDAQEFGTIEEANRFLQEAVVDRVPVPAEPQSDLDRAQDLMYEAFEATGRKRTRLARQALAVCADCADAYVLLAEEEAGTPEEALQLYRQGVEAAERVLGPKVFTERRGKFWGFVETRPYMRARYGLALALWDTGQRDEAIAHLQAMLDLNPNDNQGVRCELAMWLLELRRLQELETLFRRYPGDRMLPMVWARTIWTFLTEGAGPAATRAFRRAVDRNPHLLELVFRRKAPKMPTDGYVTVGGETEAIDLLDALFRAIGEDAALMEWFADEVHRLLDDSTPGPGSLTH